MTEPPTNKLPTNRFSVRLPSRIELTAEGTLGVTLAAILVAALILI